MLYIVIIIIAIIIIVVVLNKPKPINTPTVTTIIYSAKVLEYYNELISQNYSEIQTQLKSITELVNNIKSASDQELKLFPFFPDLDKYKSLYLQFFEFGLKAMSIMQDRSPTSEEKSMILNNINQMVITQGKIPNFSGMKNAIQVTLPAFTPSFQTDQMNELGIQLRQIQEKLGTLLSQPMTPTQSDQVTQIKSKFNEMLKLTYVGSDELKKLQILIANKEELYVELQPVLSYYTTMSNQGLYSIESLEKEINQFDLQISLQLKEKMTPIQSQQVKQILETNEKMLQEIKQEKMRKTMSGNRLAQSTQGNIGKIIELQDILENKTKLYSMLRSVFSNQTTSSYL
jgi:hypothetical protein